MNSLTVVALASLVAAPVPKEAPKPPSLDGDWKMVALIHSGMPRGPERLGGLAVIKGDAMTVREGEGDEAMTFQLDPKATPATIDITPGRGAAPGQVVKGIYKLENDKLTICFTMGGAERPKEFQSGLNSNVGLLVLERVKK